MDFIRAYFANNERTVVKAIYQNDEGKEIPQIISAEEGNPKWEELKNLISIDDLHEATYKYLKSEEETFKQTVMTFAKEKGMVLDIDSANTDTYKKLISIIFNDEGDEKQKKETLFMFKLALFEFDQIKNSENRDLKASLRKSTTIIEAFKHAIEIIEQD